MTDKKKNTALHKACTETGNKEIIEMLVDSGADITSKNKSEKTPLMYAVKNAEIEVIRYLIDQGADIKYENKYGVSAFSYAKKRRDKEIIRLLKEYLQD